VLAVVQVPCNVGSVPDEGVQEVGGADGAEVGAVVGDAVYAVIEGGYGIEVVERCGADEAG
jgi:hypothetical protein